MQKQTGQPLRTATTGRAGGRHARHRSAPKDAVLVRMPATLLDALPHAAVLYARDGVIAYANPAAWRLLAADGVPTGVDPHVPYVSRLPRFDPRTPPGTPLPPTAWPVTRILAGETIPADAAVPMLLALPGQGDIQVACSGSPVRDDAGRLIGALLIAAEVPARAESAPDLLGTLFDSIGDAIVVLGADGEVLRRNEAARKMFYDATEADFTDEPLSERRREFQLYGHDGALLTNENWPAVRVLRGETLAGANTQDINYVTRAGHRLWLNASGVPLRDGERITGAVVVYRDITERRLTEQRTDEVLDALLEMAQLVVQVPTTESDTAAPADADVSPAEAALARSELAAAHQIAELTRHVLGCTRAGIVAIDIDTRRQRPVAVVGLSPEQTRAWWAEQEALPAYGEGADPAELTRFEAGETFVLDMTKPPYDALPNPYNIRTVVIAPMRVGGKLVGMLSLDHSGAEHVYTAREIQLIEAAARLGALVIERERLFRERAQAQADLLAAEEANQRMATFLSLASHELRTPVTVILPNVEVLERRARLAAEGAGPRERQTADLAERVHRQTIRLQHLIENLLDISRIHEDRLELEIQPVDLGVLAREMVGELAGAHADRAIELVLPDVPVEAPGDALRLGQALANFLTNALKYAPGDQPIYVRVLREPTSARVEVQDFGPGISPDEQPRIWDLWQRAEHIQATGNGVNLGLGLHITRTIVERHGGTVGVESTPGQGSTFWFRIPLAPTPVENRSGQPVEVV